MQSSFTNCPLDTTEEYTGIKAIPLDSAGYEYLVSHNNQGTGLLFPVAFLSTTGEHITKNLNCNYAVKS